MILDTNAISALFSGDDSINAALEGAEKHHLPVIVVGEYLFGLERAKSKTILDRLLVRLVEESHILPIDVNTAQAYVTVRLQLKEQGTPIPENDVWIAALARQHELTVLSRDRHFDAVKGIRRIAW